jgi:leader peptidase (prepilin peptidase)/N-methyltransferase
MLNIFAQNHPAIVYLFLGILGACFGSFAGVIISRWPQGISIVSPSSFCSACNKPLKIWHNIPIISWFLLRGRCAYCKLPYGFRPLLLELIFSLSLMAIYAKFGLSFALIEKFIFVFILLCLAYIDLDTFCLPHSLLIGLLFLGGLSSLFYYLFPQYWQSHEELSFFSILILPHSASFSLANRLAGLMIGFTSFSLINLIATALLRKTKRLTAEQWAMGWGDPILLGAIGLFVGLSHLLLVIFLASAAGSVIGIIHKFRVEKEIADENDIARGAIPYGPFLALASIFVYLF